MGGRSPTAGGTEPDSPSSRVPPAVGSEGAAAERDRADERRRLQNASDRSHSLKQKVIELQARESTLQRSLKTEIRALIALLERHPLRAPDASGGT